jgi:hypothetical protein
VIGPFLAMLLAPLDASHALARAEAELRASEETLKPHTDGFSLDKDPKAPALLDRHWAAIRRWTENWFDENGTDPKRLGQAAAGIDKDLRITVLRIAPGLLAVSAHENEIGTIFILRRLQGSYHTVWTISAPERAALSAQPALVGWAPAMAVRDCRGHRAYCGPLYGSLRRLPAQKDGRPRFYVDATYAQSMGGTVEGQLSIWRWDGRQAVPLFARTYAYMVDQPYVTGFRHGVLHVGTKGEFNAFHSCGDCNGRQMDWRIAVGPVGIRDLGRVDRFPELAFVDDVLDHLSHHRLPVRAAPGADLDLLRRQEFDMVGGWNVHRDGRREELCIGWDSATDIFVLQRAKSGFRLLSVREGPQTGCPGKTTT